MSINLKVLITKIRKSYWVKSGTLVLTTRISLLAIGFISFLILIRILDKEEYGIWVIFMTITSLVETVRIGFLKSPLMILNADKAIQKSRLYATAFYLNLFSAFIFGIIVIITVTIWDLAFEDSLIRNIFYLYVIKLIVISIADHLDLIQETNLDFRGTFQDLFARNFVFLVLLIVYLVSRKDLTLNSLVIFQIIGGLTGMMLSMVNAYIKKIDVLQTFHFDRFYSERFLLLGKFTFGSSLVSITVRNVDTWMLGILISPSAVAIYNPALRISNIFEIPSSSMSTILLPKLTDEISKEGTESIAYYYERSMTYILMFMIPILVLFVFFSDEIIMIIAGHGFEVSGDLLKLTMFYGILIPFNRQFTVILDALGKPKISFVLIVITLVFSLVFNFIFIQKYGLFGAVYGSLTTYILIFIFTQAYLNRQFGTRIWEIILGIFPGYLVLLKRVIKFINE